MDLTHPGLSIDAVVDGVCAEVARGFPRDTSEPESSVSQYGEELGLSSVDNIDGTLVATSLGSLRRVLDTVQCQSRDADTLCSKDAILRARAQLARAVLTVLRWSDAALRCEALELLHEVLCAETVVKVKWTVKELLILLRGCSEVLEERKAVMSGNEAKTSSASSSFTRRPLIADILAVGALDTIRALLQTETHEPNFALSWVRVYSVRLASALLDDCSPVGVSEDTSLSLNAAAVVVDLAHACGHLTGDMYAEYIKHLADGDPAHGALRGSRMRITMTNGIFMRVGLDAARHDLFAFGVDFIKEWVDAMTPPDVQPLARDVLARGIGAVDWEQRLRDGDVSRLEDSLSILFFDVTWIAREHPALDRSAFWPPFMRRTVSHTAFLLRILMRGADSRAFRTAQGHLECIFDDRHVSKL